MATGWRRAFCTSVPRDRDSSTTVVEEKEAKSSPRLCIKFSFFSNHSANRAQSQPVSSPGVLRCRTTTATATVPIQSVSESPKLQCKAKNSPRFFQLSSSSSPRSPSTFSLLKSSFHSTRSRCGICSQSVRAGQRRAVFTAECSHSFHFPCIASHLNQGGDLDCPVCGSRWREPPVLSIDKNDKPEAEENNKTEIFANDDGVQRKNSRFALKIYNDDEPLMSPTSGARFNPIPESDENEDEEDSVENGGLGFRGFFPNASPIVELSLNSRDVELNLSPEAAIISMGRSSVTCAVVLKVRAPPVPAKAARRAPIDLVMLVDVSDCTTSEKLIVMKRAMRLVVSSLSSADRLSIVAFSGVSKRLLPLKRMTSNGRLSARRIVDALVPCQGTSSVGDALKKAAKVLQDRRQRNPVASVILLSDGHDGPLPAANPSHNTRHSSLVSSTRFPNLEIPVHSICFRQLNRHNQSSSPDNAIAKCIGNLLNVVVQDLRLELGFVAGSGRAEIAAVYSYTGRPASLGSGSVRLGDLYAEEDREILIEVKVPSSAIVAHHVLSVRYSYKDPSTQERISAKQQALTVPRPLTVRSSNPTIARLRSIFIKTRAIAESRRLIERNDFSGARHMLSSARALLLQPRSASAEEFIRSLEAELAELNRKRENQTQLIQRPPSSATERGSRLVDEKSEPLTPTSAWKAAERLAKVAIMRKSMNRVGDLHGFEDARF